MEAGKVQKISSLGRHLTKLLTSLMYFVKLMLICIFNGEAITFFSHMPTHGRFFSALSRMRCFSWTHLLFQSYREWNVELDTSEATSKLRAAYSSSLLGYKLLNKRIATCTWCLMALTGFIVLLTLHRIYFRSKLAMVQI